MSQFASGRYAIAYCDVCGFETPYRELRALVVKLKKTDIRACNDCWVPDQPQLQVGMWPVYDPQALREARPDQDLTEQRDIQWGWNPVGGARSEGAGLTPNTLVAEGEVGTVTVTTS